MAKARRYDSPNWKNQMDDYELSSGEDEDVYDGDERYEQVGQRGGSSRDMSDVLLHATKENPVFVKMDLYETPSYYRESEELPYATNALIAVSKVSRDEDYDYYVHGDVLDPGAAISEPVFRRQPQFGDYMGWSIADFEGEIVQQPTAEMQNLYSQFQELHENAPYKVKGALYAEEAIYSSWDDGRQFPQYARLDATSQTWDLDGAKLRDGRDVNSLDTAEMWMLENHPAYIQGMSIYQDIPSGNFMLSCVPCPEYKEGEYETYEGRRQYAAEKADRLGVTLGKETAEDVLTAWREKNRGRELPDIENIAGTDKEKTSGPELG